jgi:hypothetical protein
MDYMPMRRLWWLLACVLLWSSQALGQSTEIGWEPVTTDTTLAPITVSHYNVYRCIQDAGGLCPGQPMFLASVQAPTTTYRDTAVIDANRYRYEVSAVSNGIESARSSYVTARPQKSVIITK